MVGTVGTGGGTHLPRRGVGGEGLPRLVQGGRRGLGSRAGQCCAPQL